MEASFQAAVQSSDVFVNDGRAQSKPMEGMKLVQTRRRRSWWILLARPFGLTTWVMFIVLAIRERRPRWLFYSLLYLALAAAPFVLGQTSIRSFPVEVIAALCVVVAWIAGIVQGVFIDRRINGSTLRVDPSLPKNLLIPVWPEASDSLPLVTPDMQIRRPTRSVTHMMFLRVTPTFAGAWIALGAFILVKSRGTAALISLLAAFAIMVVILLVEVPLIAKYQERKRAVTREAIREQSPPGTVFVTPASMIYRCLENGYSSQTAKRVIGLLFVGTEGLAFVPQSSEWPERLAPWNEVEKLSLTQRVKVSDLGGLDATLNSGEHT